MRPGGGRAVFSSLPDCPLFDDGKTLEVGIDLFSHALVLGQVGLLGFPDSEKALYCLIAFINDIIHNTPWDILSNQGGI